MLNYRSQTQRDTFCYDYIYVTFWKKQKYRKKNRAVLARDYGGMFDYKGKQETITV